MAQYPSEIYTPRARENRSGVVYDADKKTVIFAEDINKSDDEVVAIENELGLNPKGQFANVRERIEKILSGILTTKGDLAVAVGPVGHWKMNDNAANTTVVDDSGLGNNGTAQSNTNTLTAEGKINTALSFDTDQYISIPTTSPLDITGDKAFSVALWLYITEALPSSKYANIFSFRPATSRGIGIRLNSGSKLDALFRTDAESKTISGTTVLSLNTWYFVVLTNTPGGKFKLYINNIFEGEQDSITTLTPTSNRIGGNAIVGGNPDWLKGRIDDFRIIRHILTSDEMTEIYNSGNGTEDMLPVVRRLPVGTDGQRLQADSSTPEGMKWVTP